MEIGLLDPGAGDRLPFGHHRAVSGGVAEPLHHPAAHRRPRLPPVLRRVRPRRLHLSG